MKRPKQRIIEPQKYYGGIAGTYDVSAVRDHRWVAPQHVFRHVQGFRQRLDGLRLLDLGIGTGLTTQPFASAGALCHGIDASPEMLQRCEVKKIAEVKKHDLHQRPYPYAAEKFDVIISDGVLYFIRKLLPVLQEVHRLLKSDGIFQMSLETFETTPVGERMMYGDGLIDKDLFEESQVVAYLHKEVDIERRICEAGLRQIDKQTFSAGCFGGSELIDMNFPQLDLLQKAKIRRALEIHHVSYICEKE